MFGRRKKNTSKPLARAHNEINPANTIQATSKLKETQGNLEKRVAFLRKKADNQLGLAKAENAKKNKDQALHHLKRKQILDKEIKTIESSILTIEEQVLRIEGGSAVSDIYEALRLANAAMQKVNERVNPDKLADLLGEIEDLNTDQDEIHDILGVKQQESLEDQQLLAELDEIGADQLEEGILTARAPTKADAEEETMLRELTRHDTMDLKGLADLIAPKKVPVIKKPEPLSKDEQALADLEAEMMA